LIDKRLADGSLQNLKARFSVRGDHKTAGVGALSSDKDGESGELIFNYKSIIGMLGTLIILILISSLK